MKRFFVSAVATVLSVACSSTCLEAAELISRKTDTGVIVGYKDTPLQPWTDNKYCVHDPDCPPPRFVLPRPLGTPLPAAPIPNDAVILFDGTATDQWKASTWKVEEGALLAGAESLESLQAFGDCQIHLEFATPEQPSENFMNRGNSGVMIMGKYEIQIFDSWPEHKQQIYADGQAASLYGQAPPLVNACMPPGQWQSYDIVFTAPRFKAGKLSQRGTITMLHNGLLVHLNQPVMGEMAHRGITPCSPHPSQLPLVLQGHGSSLRFRNIWVRPVDLPE